MKRKIITIFLTIAMVLAICLGVAACDRSLTKLSSPQNFQVEKRILTWDKVDHATGYLLFVNGQEYTVEENSFNMRFCVREGDYNLKIMALGDEKKYADSAWTDTKIILEAPLEHGFDEAGLEYTFLEEELGYEVQRGRVNLEGEIIIPDYFEDYPVVHIARYGFSLGWTGNPNPPSAILGTFCNTVTTGIKLPSFLRSIDEWAFCCLFGLTEIEIPPTVTKLGGFAFDGCIHLKKIVIPEGVKEIPYHCFSDTGLEEVVFPNGLEEIGNNAFQCGTTPESIYIKLPHVASQLSSIVIPDSVKFIGFNAFQGRENLRDITMSKNIEDIATGAFADTAWYDAQPEGVIYFNENIIYGYKGEMPEGTELVIPPEIKFVCPRAFEGQKGLEKVFVSDGVELKGAVFIRCASLSEVRLPSDLTAIPASLLYGTNIKSIVIPEGVTKIGASAFKKSALERIVLPKNVKEIGQDAFLLCKNLKEVVLNEGLEVIEEMAFQECTALTAVKFPSTLMVIGNIAFMGCTALTAVEFPSSLCTIGQCAFWKCEALTEVVFKNVEGWTIYDPKKFFSLYDTPPSKNALPEEVFEAETFASADLVAYLTDTYYKDFWICGEPDALSKYLFALDAWAPNL